ncbi:MAG TPA: (Fe-S)-binding protein [Bacillota bacterium]
MSPEELEQKLIQCTRCGTCLKDCPVYKETLDEQYTARAKINLVKAIYFHDRMKLDNDLRDIAEMCLLCKSCQTACPNNVDGPEFTLFLREQIVGRFGQSGIKRTIFNSLLPKPGLLGFFARLAAFGQALSLDRVAGAVTGRNLRKIIDYAPKVSARSFSAIHPAGTVLAPLGGGQPKARVAYFYGCVTNLVTPPVGQATVDVLRRNGYEVVIPAQSCCGVPASANGDFAAATQMAGDNINSFLKAGFDWVIADCASCSSTLKEYGQLLGHDQAKAFAAKVRDINEFLVAEGYDRDGLGEVRLTVTYHDPCHLKRYQNIAAQPRAILKSIPGVTFKEMKEADKCCGASGSFVLTHHDISLRIGDKKGQNALATGADAVVTGCPSCRMQIANATRRAGRELPVHHPVELLAWAYAAKSAGARRAAQNISEGTVQNRAVAGGK